MAAYLIDTNILLRFVKHDDADYAVVRSAIERLWVAGDDLFYTSQNLAEFWNSCTCPVEKKRLRLDRCRDGGGCGRTNSQAKWTWGGGVNTHLHIFFARHDPTDNEWYFIDPYGVYAPDNCYPALNRPINTPCARYPVAWKGGKAQYL